MSNKQVHIFMFIDALGWEIIKDKNFLEDLLPYRNPAKMQFGYSSTAIPTILSGQPPIVHKHLSFYYYAPEKSPFKIFKYLLLGMLPEKINRSWRVRHNLSKLVKKMYGFTGYFELYAMPFSHLPYFDYIEKKDMFVPDGLAPVKNLADELESRSLPYHISNWRLSEAENIAALKSDLENGEIKFAFLYTAAMDGLLHRVTKEGKEIPEKLNWYSEQIRALIEIAKKKYDDCTFTVFSDHGMTTKVGVVDVISQIEGLKLKFGKDYAAVYDSTMGRFWYFNDHAKNTIREKFSDIPHTSVVGEEDKERFRVNFPDNMYGEDILLLDPGWQIEPSDMGLKALPGMHGYTPDHPDSDASFLSSREVENPPQWVGDFFRVMTSRMDELAGL